MTEPATALASAPAPPADPVADLIQRINAAHQEVRLALKRTGEAAIEAGKLLLKVKRYVRHGNFGEWIAAHCTFSDRTAQLYMQLARKFPNPQNFADFSLSDLMQMLEPAKVPEIRAEPKSKKAKTDKIAEAIKNDALAILQKAWDQTSPTERSIFLSQVGANRPRSV
jgi:hypothetical protein